MQVSEGTSLKGAVASVNTEPLGSVCQEQRFENNIRQLYIIQLPDM